MTNKWILGVVGVCVAAVAVFVGVSLGSDSVDKPDALASSTTTSGAASSSTSAPAGSDELTEFQAKEAGFAISYPKAWTAYESSDKEILLVAAERPPAENRGGSVLVRAVSIGAKITQADLATAKTLTDSIVTANKDVEITIPATEINQGGLPGLAYVYTFTDPTSGGKGVHSHYFLFKDQMMISFVFQAIPVEEFNRLNTLFDRLAQTFRVL